MMRYLESLKENLRGGSQGSASTLRRRYDESPRLKNIVSYIKWEDYLGIGILLVGLFGYFYPDASKFLFEMHAEFIGIGATVLIIDNANEAIKRREEKKRLILQMGSPDHAFAIEAVRQLRERGWLGDGSLKNAHLNGADLSGADLNGADLSRASLFQANLRGASLYEVNLSKAYLRRSNLCGADLSCANLGGANISVVDMSGANLSGADMSGADLRRSNLSGAILEGSNLSGARLSWAKNIVDAQLARAITDQSTIMPDGSQS